MKKFFLGMLAIVAMIATSCQQEVDLGVNAGETATVSFNVGTPTRAYSDGTTATVLQYAVYDAAGNELTDLTVTDGEIHGSTTVNLQLVTGNTYAVIFWAAAEDAPYSVDFANQTMTVNYNGAVSNDENRDAFYKYHEFTVTGAQTETIELKRPFAQLNIGTNDYAAAASAGYTPETSWVVVKNIYNTLDLNSGAVSNPVEVTFAENAIPTTETFPVGGHEYLAMNYLLVGTQQENIEVEFTYANAANDAKTRTVGSVPVQRNHRTNLYGSILTSDVAINVEIKPEYNEPAYNNEGYYVEEGITYVTSANGFATVAAAIADGTLPNDITLALEGDIDLANLSTRSTATWAPIGTYAEPFMGTFNGNGYTIKNFNYVSEGSDSYVGFFGYAKSATIKNVVFENVNVQVTGADGGDHIAAVVGVLATNDPDSAIATKSYVENVTVKGNIYIDSNVAATGSSRVAVVVGGNNNSDVVLKNVHVIANEGSYVKANSYAGGIVGQTNRRASFENCTSNIDVTATRFFAGGIAGAPGNEVSFVNCHSTGDITVTAGRSGAAHDHYRVGGIAGGWDDNTYFPLVLTNCSYTGKLSGTNADGTVAEKFDYLGFVGRGYSVKNGSKVVIDGFSFVQTDKGVYEVTKDGEAVELVSNGLLKSGSEYSVLNAEGLALLNQKMIDKSAGQNVVVEILTDIDFTGKTWTPVDSHVDFGFTLKSINGNGHTIKNLTINGQAMFTRFSNNNDVVVKDITFDNAKVNSTSINTAIIVGHTYDNVLLNNVDVKNSAIVGGYKVAPLVGTVYDEKASTVTATLKNCDVEKTTVKALSYDFCTTGMVAFVYAGSNDKIEFENCTVSNVRLYAPNVYTAHAAIYTTGSETLFNEAEGVTVTNVTFENI